jgi:hypothetical protein
MGMLYTDTMLLFVVAYHVFVLTFIIWIFKKIYKKIMLLFVILIPSGILFPYALMCCMVMGFLIVSEIASTAYFAVARS